MRAFQHDTHWYEVFDTYHEFVDYANGNNITKGASSQNGSEDFTGTASFADAVTLARYGYTEVRPQVEALMEIMEERLAERFGNRFVTEYAVCGGSVDMGKFVTGEPECMLDWAQEPAASMGRVVKVVIAGSVSWQIEKEWIMSRGTAVLALVDTLHKLGVGVEVWWESTVSGGRTPDEANRFTTAVKLHDSSEPMDIDNLMFALAHPSMLRRMVFSVQEQSRYRKEQGAHDGSGYGRPEDMGLVKVDEFDVRIERLQNGRGDIVKNPLAWVISTVEGLGFTE